MQQPPPPPQQPAFSSYPPPYTPFSPQPPSTQKIALKFGLIFGAIFVGRLLLETVFYFAYNQSLPVLVATYHLALSAISALSLTITAFFTLIDWIIYFLAGFFTARRARNVNAAVIACLWANLCYGVISLVLTAISVLSTMSILAGRENVLTGYLPSVGLNVVVDLFLLHIGVGTGIGALGGLLGKSTAPREVSQPRS